jgi:hypothetical protein
MENRHVREDIFNVKGLIYPGELQEIERETINSGQTLVFFENALPEVFPLPGDTQIDTFGFG